MQGLLATASQDACGPRMPSFGVNARKWQAPMQQSAKFCMFRHKSDDRIQQVSGTVVSYLPMTNAAKHGTKNIQEKGTTSSKRTHCTPRPGPRSTAGTGRCMLETAAPVKEKYTFTAKAQKKNSQQCFHGALGSTLHPITEGASASCGLMHLAIGARTIGIAGGTNEKS